MGLLDFNITEIASRIVRGAGVRGRIRPTLDDGIVPVAQVIDYSTAPYRLDEQKYLAAIPNSSAAAGDSAVLAFINKSPKPVVVEWWQSSERVAGNPRIMVSMQTRTLVDTLLQVGGDVAFTCYENGPSPWTIRNDLVLRNLAVVAGVFPIVGNFLGTYELAAGFSMYSPVGLDLVVTPGSALTFSGFGLTDRFSLAMQIRVVNNTTIP